MSIKPAVEVGLRATGFPAFLQNRSQAANGSGHSPDGGLSTSLLYPGSGQEEVTIENFVVTESCEKYGAELLKKYYREHGVEQLFV